MADKKRSIARTVAHAAGWQVFKRGAKMLPFGGTLVVAALVGSDIRRKGLVKGVVNSGLDAIPILGLVKNGVELFTGDFIPDKPDNGSKKPKKVKK
ncbi:MAG: hypothetical protein QUS14_16190 [Pyrinomonadaceae bacterium]|nr:hypothetical protein [Pyrinomonadaceae bacterium]